MARYELGAIYKIDGGEGTYYARLLTQDTYGIFEPVEGEISEEKFSKLGYRLYICTGSFAVKRGFWEKLIPSTDKMDTERWSRPPHLVNFLPWNIEESLESSVSLNRSGNTEVIDRKEYIKYLKQGFISVIMPRYELIPNYLDRMYDNWPESAILQDLEFTNGTEEHRRKQIKALKKLGYDVSGYEEI